MFANYELLDQICSENFSEIYRAKEPLTGRIVLIKRMSDRAKTNNNLVKRFQREIRLAAQLSHPNLVATYHAGFADRNYYLVMENVEGVDLATKVRNEGPLDLNTAVEYLCQAAKGLAYLHQRGVFHRNVKPASLILDDSGVVHVTNMAFAKVDEDSGIDIGNAGDLTRNGQLIGATDYLAPEQALDAHSADHRSDIYSLGCTFCYLLTGKPPYPEQDRAKKISAHIRGPIPSLRGHCPAVSETMDQVFQRMLAKMPDERYQSADAVVTALRQALLECVRSTDHRQERFAWPIAIGFLVVGITAGGLVSLLFTWN